MQQKYFEIVIIVQRGTRVLAIPSFYSLTINQADFKRILGWNNYAIFPLTIILIFSTFINKRNQFPL